jgi:Uncharacterized conserved domain (SAYSvFN)
MITAHKTRLVIFTALQIIAVFAGFGLIFFVAAGVFFIYSNAPNGTEVVKKETSRLVAVKKNKKKKEVSDVKSSGMSAYSVFNKGGESIAGTVTAEQIDAALRKR